MSFTPKIVQTKPFIVNEIAGTDRAWCSCGLSKTEPYCDGTHKVEDVGGLRSVHVLIEKDGPVAWCACKQTKTPPYCDGTHKKLNKDI